MDRTAVESAVGFLTHRFQVRGPRIHFTGRGGRGHYQATRIGTLCYAKIVEPWLVAHEFAHHLDRCRNFTGRRGKREWHSESFYSNLKQVIAAFGIANYPWAIEYRQLARWAKRDGLI